MAGNPPGDMNSPACTALINAVLVNSTRRYGPPGHRRGQAFRLLLNHLNRAQRLESEMETAGRRNV